MSTILLCVGLVLALSGCATTDMVKLGEPQTVSVTWTRVKPASCGSTEKAQACARRDVNYTRCTITALEDAPDAVLGHELRHCFGWEHSADVPRIEAARKRASAPTGIGRSP